MTVPAEFSAALNRALFAHYADNVDGGHVGGDRADAYRRKIEHMIRVQAERTGRAIGSRMADTDVDYLIAVLIFTDLAQAPGVISIEEARLIWREAEDLVLWADIVAGFAIVRLANGLYAVAPAVEGVLSFGADTFRTRDEAVAYATAGSTDE